MNQDQLSRIGAVKETGLTGAQIIECLQRGHMVRRACWQDGYLIRICNEDGFDASGKTVFDDRKDELFTVCTDGYFMHLGYSSQPFRELRTWNYNGSPQIASRDGGGIGSLFATDWEDYGFIEAEAFRELEKELKEVLREDRDLLREQALIKAANK